MANEHAIQATGTFVVSKGFRLLTKLAASQGSLQFTRAAVGTGKPPEGYSPESMIGLNAYKIDAEIADYGVQDDMAYITVQVSSDNVTEGFLVTEVGVFAEDPDEGEILYGYMDISTDPTYIYANGSTNRSKFAEFTLYVLVGSVSNVIAAVTPGSIITRDTFTAANLKAIDTHGILGGEAGAETTGQGLIDALTNKLLTEFVTNTVLMERLGTYVLKSKIVNDFLSTDEETVLSGPMGKLLKEQLNVLNTNLINMSRTNAINGDIATFADNAPLNTFLRRRYEITNGTASGAPDAQDGYVEIHKTVSNDWIVIYAITNRGTVYTRAKTEGVWGAWTNCNDKLGVSIQRLEYRWDNQNPKLIVTDPNGYSAYVSLTKYQG